jgi:hypothetical protein
MQETVRIRTATRADAERLSETLILAFAADSMARWIWPDGRNYISSIKKIFWSFGGLSARRAPGAHVCMGASVTEFSMKSR